jgi:rhodanese-related sulfurtransferase
MVAISVLKQRGYHNLIQVEGGIDKWQMHGFETVRDNLPLISL